MEIKILYSPSYSIANVKLEPDEQIQVESGAMVSTSFGVNIETKATGGFFKALGRSMLGGESFFMNTFTAPANGGEINLAPSLPGDMFVLDIDNQTMLVQSGSYCGSSMGINIDTKWGGAKTFFASEGLILLKATGKGKLILSSYGAIHEINLAHEEKYIVDTGHLVAFDESLGFVVKKVGGLKSTLLSGEGLVVELTGPGKALLQTRSVNAFLSWLIPKLPKNNN
ncbi:MAG: TIGR00266 family protein [Actinobacteria bacterium]|nr:TIGR00266 family protein [Cyanobacteriota bacterium]MCL5770867.1 TIGR00266 family protein [Actinomycetota bacterium]